MTAPGARPLLEILLFLPMREQSPAGPRSGGGSAARVPRCPAFRAQPGENHLTVTVPARSLRDRRGFNTKSVITHQFDHLGESEPAAPIYAVSCAFRRQRVCRYGDAGHIACPAGSVSLCS